MDLVALKIVFLVATFVVCLVAGCVPVALLQTDRIPWQSSTAIKIIRGLMALSLGVFLAICFVGLLPSVQNTQDSLSIAFKLDIQYPLSEVCVLGGLFLFWLTAELTKSFYERRRAKAAEEQIQLCGGDAPPPPEDANNVYRALPSCHDMRLPDQGDSNSFFSLLLIVTGLSIKSVLEGITIGSLPVPGMVIQLGTAKLVHEVICTSVMALNLASVFQRNPWYHSYLAIAAFATVNAAGIGVGIGVGASATKAGLAVKFVLQALAAGAMLYVVLTLFVQMNQTLQPDDLAAGVKFACVLGGFLLFALVRSLHTMIRHKSGGHGVRAPGVHAPL